MQTLTKKNNHIMKKICIVILAVAIFSCKQPVTEIAAAKAPVDSLVTNWSNAWSNNDSVEVAKLFTADALLIDDNLIATNTADIAARWIHPNIHVVKNLTTKKLQEWSTNDRAGYTGKYTLDVVVNDSVIAKPAGVFTVNWVKTDSLGWKITTADIHTVVEKK
jgi:ketosteroid isomerase-like protein